MLLHDGMHVTEAEAETLDVVDISGGHTIQLVKNLANMFAGNSDAIVGEGSTFTLVFPQSTTA